MSKLKDKLSANMRMVKASQRPATKPAAKPIAKSAASKPATPAAPKKSAPRTSGDVADSMGEVPNSGSALFPSRVWPD